MIRSLSVFSLLLMGSCFAVAQESLCLTLALPVVSSPTVMTSGWRIYVQNTAANDLMVRLSVLDFHWKIEEASNRGWQEVLTGAIMPGQPSSGTAPVSDTDNKQVIAKYQRSLIADFDVQRDIPDGALERGRGYRISFAQDVTLVDGDIERVCKLVAEPQPFRIKSSDNDQMNPNSQISSVTTARELNTSRKGRYKTGRVIAKDAYIRLSQMNSGPNVETLVIRVEESSRRAKSPQFLKVRYEDYAGQHPLPPELLEGKSSWQFWLRRERSCDHIVSQGLFAANRDSNELPKTGTFVLVETADQKDTPPIQSTIPCFILRPGSVKPLNGSFVTPNNIATAVRK